MSCGIIYTLLAQPINTLSQHTLLTHPTLSTPITTAEDNIKSLPRLMAASIGRDIEQLYRSANGGKLEDVTLLQKITEANRAAVRALVSKSTNSDGRVTEVAPFMKQLGGFMSGIMGGSAMKKALATAGFAGVTEDELTTLNNYLEGGKDDDHTPSFTHPLITSSHTPSHIPSLCTPSHTPSLTSSNTSSIIITYILIHSLIHPHTHRLFPLHYESLLLFISLLSLTSLLLLTHPSQPPSLIHPSEPPLPGAVLKIVANNEVSGMLSALEGRYITPGPGGDPIRNPDVLPTGKNMHGLDPQSIPTAAAVDVALTVANRLLERMKQDTGAYPQVTPLSHYPSYIPSN